MSGLSPTMSAKLCRYANLFLEIQLFQGQLILQRLISSNERAFWMAIAT